MSVNEEENFEIWLTDMPDALDRFFDSVPDYIVNNLDFSEGSLDVIEHWLLNNFKDVDQYKNSAASSIFDGVPRYVGEVFRKKKEGLWDIELKNKKNVFYGLPIVVDAEKRGTPLCPHRLVTALFDRNTGHYLSDIFRQL